MCCWWKSCVTVGAAAAEIDSSDEWKVRDGKLGGKPLKVYRRETWVNSNFLENERKSTGSSGCSPRNSFISLVSWNRSGWFATLKFRWIDHCFRLEMCRSILSTRCRWSSSHFRSRPSWWFEFQPFKLGNTNETKLNFRFRWAKQRQTSHFRSSSQLTRSWSINFSMICRSTSTLFRISMIWIKLLTLAAW